MSAKIKYRSAASPSKPDIARLRSQATRFRGFVEKHLKKAMKASPGTVTLTCVVTMRERDGVRWQIVRGWPPSPPGDPLSPVII